MEDETTSVSFVEEEAELNTLLGRLDLAGFSEDVSKDLEDLSVIVRTHSASQYCSLHVHCQHFTPATLNWLPGTPNA